MNLSYILGFFLGLTVPLAVVKFLGSRRRSKESKELQKRFPSHDYDEWT